MIIHKSWVFLPIADPSYNHTKTWTGVVIVSKPRCVVIVCSCLSASSSSSHECVTSIRCFINSELLPLLSLVKSLLIDIMYKSVMAIKMSDMFTFNVLFWII